MKLVPYKEEDLNWTDISALEEWREYVFPAGVYHIEHPISLNVKRKPEGDSHRVIDKDGIRHYIPVGWMAMRFKGKWGFQPKEG